MLRRPPRTTQSRSSAASDVYNRYNCHPVLIILSLIFIIFIFFVNCLLGEVALAAMKATKMSSEDIEKANDEMREAVVQASTIDPKKIERAIMKQLAAGKSGLTNLADVETLLANISSFQDDKRESIVAASTGDLSVLSEIIVNSDSEQSLSLMQGVMENDTGNASLLMSEIMGGEGEKADFDIFSPSIVIIPTCIQIFAYCFDVKSSHFAISLS